MGRKNGRQLAEHAGHATLDGLQHVPARSHGDAGRLRDDLQSSAAEQLGASDGVLIIDDTGFVKKGTTSAGVQQPYAATAGRTGRRRSVPRRRGAHLAAGPRPAHRPPHRPGPTRGMATPVLRRRRQERAALRMRRPAARRPGVRRRNTHPATLDARPPQHHQTRRDRLLPGQCTTGRHRPRTGPASRDAAERPRSASRARTTSAARTRTNSAATPAGTGTSHSSCSRTPSSPRWLSRNAKKGG
ncbi:transposase [Streptomyces sp. NBC_00009]|uniref:transposase n=1 Tax=Streptomyces sp. NBC_00009 TaxID=2975620 RepID=UPI003248F5CB